MRNNSLVCACLPEYESEYRLTWLKLPYILDGLAVLALEDVSILPPLGFAVADTASFSSASSSIASSDVVDELGHPSLRLRVKREPNSFIMLLLLLLLCTLLFGLLEMVLLLPLPLPLDKGRRGSSIPSSDRLDKLLFELSLREECGVERVGRLDRRDADSIVPVCVCCVLCCVCSRQHVKHLQVAEEDSHGPDNGQAWGQFNTNP